MVGQGTIVATGSIAYPVGLGAIGELIGAEKVMTMTSTYDHRIIQGAESGRFLAADRGAAAGRGGLLRARSSQTSARSCRRCPRRPRRRRGRGRRGRPTPRATPGARRSRAERGAAAGRAGRDLAAARRYRTHGHLAAHLDPLGREPERRPGARPRPARAHARADGADPGAGSCACTCPGATLADALPHLRETYCGTIAYEIEHIASHRQRLWLREAIESGTFREPLTNDEQKAAAASG